MKEVVKSNGKMYWDKPLITGVQVYSGNHFDLFIPIGHDQFMVEEYSDYDMLKDWGKNEVEYTYEEVIKRFEPSGSELVAIDRIGKKAKEETKWFWIHDVIYDTKDDDSGVVHPLSECYSTSGHKLSECKEFPMEVDVDGLGEEDWEIEGYLMDQISDRLGWCVKHFESVELPKEYLDKLSSKN